MIVAVAVDVDVIGPVIVDVHLNGTAPVDVHVDVDVDVIVDVDVDGETQPRTNRVRNPLSGSSSVAGSTPHDFPKPAAISAIDRRPSIIAITPLVNTADRRSASHSGRRGIGARGSVIHLGSTAGRSTAAGSAAVLLAANPKIVSTRCEPLSGDAK